MLYETERDTNIYYRKGSNGSIVHFHRSVEIVYVLSGVMPIIINGKKLELKEKDVLFCAPFTQHFFPYTDKSTQIVAVIPVDYCQKFDEFCKTHTPVLPIVRDKTGEYLKLISQLESPKNKLYFEGVVNCLLGLFLSDAEFARKNTPSVNNLIQEIVEYVDTNYMNQITLSHLANRFGYSANYFSELFKKCFLSNISYYINSVRVEKSLSLLKKGQKITSVCYECGFQSPQQYYLYFKKIYNCSPKEYMLKLKADKEKQNKGSITVSKKN